jgi:hypothetical protein
VQARSADLVRFDQGNAQTKLCAAKGCGITTASSTKDDEIKLRH